MKKKVRNQNYLPQITNEGKFICPFPQPPVQQNRDAIWYKDLSPHDRLYYHQTLSTTRWSRCFKQTDKIPKDSLDFALLSTYNNLTEVFPKKVDTVMQPETCGEKETFRKLRNTRQITVNYNMRFQHPLIIGGITHEKVEPNSVKLMISGPHVQLTNNGYSRQEGDGNPFRY
ncbi:uncharacterized protein LOC119690172 [Teleopsis dalmanni]|uniref:uncharacterized protein LOC119690172 n=1 Tax=Teleopsis dalmanni TaxID=139649 RepID=UPI0018CDADEE|nr:uncharacterized protein LOC119690172 [Teleopsis dalmanni]